MIQVYQDIVQPIVRFPWESVREHEPSRQFILASSQYISLATAPVTDAPVTLACWFNPIEHVTEQALMQLQDASTANNWFAMWFRSSTIIAWARSAEASTAAIALAPFAPTDNIYQHCCNVFDSSTSRTCYLGGSAGTENTASSAPAGIDTFSIGMARDTTSGQPYGGAIFWSCVWNVGLNSTEAKRLASGVPPWYVRPESIVSCPDLESLWDPFTRESFANTGSVIINPYRDWMLPDDTALWGSVTAPVGAGLFRRRNLDGLGAGGPFFADPLAA